MSDSCCAPPYERYHDPVHTHKHRIFIFLPTPTELFSDRCVAHITSIPTKGHQRRPCAPTHAVNHPIIRVHAHDCHTNCP